MKKLIKFLFLLIIISITTIIIDIDVSANNEIDLSTVATNYIDIYSDGKHQYTLNDSEIIYDFAENMYCLQNLNPLGYMIIDIETEQLLEASFSSNSPYFSYDTNIMKFYIGPGNYFINLNDAVYDIINNVSFPYNETLISYSNVFRDNISISVQENLEEEIQICSHTTDTYGYTVIDNHEYFRNLFVFPLNSNGTCGYVALAILLGYFDTFYNGHTIPREEDISSSYSSSYFLNSLYYKETQSFTSALPDNLSINDWIDTSTSYLGGAGQELHNILENYGQYTAQNADGTAVTGVDLYNTLELYMEDYVYTLSNYFSYNHMLVNKRNYLKQQIDEGYPCIATLISYDYADYNSVTTPSAKMHNIVVYGYNGDMFLSHYGWPDRSDPVSGPDGVENYKEVLISNATIYSVFSITYKGVHYHSDNLRWNCNGCSGSFCPCGYIECNHANLYSAVSYDDTYHSKECQACGELILETHELRENNDSQLVCMDYCGYITDECVHYYEYSGGYTTSLHNMTCTMCGNTCYQAHIFKSDMYGSYCIICSYYKQANEIVPRPITTIKKEDEDE